MRGRGCIVILLTTAAGCGPSSYIDFRDQLYSKWCEHQINCGQVGSSETQKCGVPAPLALTVSGLVDIPAAMGANRLIFHPDNAKACLEEIEHLPCDAEQAADDLFRHCHGIVTPKVETGNLCYGDEECVGGVCIGAACGGTCYRYASPGDPCLATGGAPDQTCDPTVQYCDGVCKNKKHKDELCGNDIECIFDNVCVDGKCGMPPRIARDDVCGAGLPPCEDGLYCDETSSCQPLKSSGESCTRANACDVGLVCLAGTCSNWLDVGQSCTTSPLFASGCPATQACTGGVCVATATKVGPISRCTIDDDCDTGLFCQMGYCAYKGGINAACTAPNECLTGLTCTSMLCRLPVMCTM
jgi:hypothetical protein